jgi:phosphotransferase system enzyme I (PtsI)
VERNKPVTLCGEMAGRPRCVLPLLGMGLRRLSMSPAFVPTIKQLVRKLTMPVAKQVAEQVLQLRTTADVREYLTKRVKQICPDVALFDTAK